jgi:hypothetical protein
MTKTVLNPLIGITLLLVYNLLSFIANLKLVVKMTRWLVRLLSQEAGKWLGTLINSGICTIGQ